MLKPVIYLSNMYNKPANYGTVNVIWMSVRDVLTGWRFHQLSRPITVGKITVSPCSVVYNNAKCFRRHKPIIYSRPWFPVLFYSLPSCVPPSLPPLRIVLFLPPLKQDIFYRAWRNNKSIFPMLRQFCLSVKCLNNIKLFFAIYVQCKSNILQSWGFRNFLVHEGYKNVAIFGQ